MNEIESLKVFELMEGLREGGYAVILNCKPDGSDWPQPWHCCIARYDHASALTRDPSYHGYADTPLKALTAAIAAFPPGVVT